ncbi:MAG: hypothetical protein JWN48_591 [Myxococcaceae bacterium]|nr:hypothetical protein [Myxococcaceae bacterium]
MQSDSRDPEAAFNGRTIGGYTLGRELERGRLASLHLAEGRAADGSIGRVVIKRVIPELASQGGWDALIESEARLLAMLKHPNVVGVQAAGLDGGKNWLALDYIEGLSLQALLGRAGPRPAPTLLAAVMADILRGLRAVHAAADERGQPLDIVHQAPHARHIMVGHDGIARLIDLSQARARVLPHSSHRVERLRVSKMAPEQVVAPDALGPRADQFVLALTLWESLTGERLFAGKSDEETLRNLLRGSVPKPSAIGLCPPEAFDAVCLRALSFDPEERFSSAEEMLTHLLEAARATGPTPSRAEIGRWVAGVSQPAERHSVGPGLSSTTLPFDSSYRYSVRPQEKVPSIPPAAAQSPFRVAGPTTQFESSPPGASPEPEVAPRRSPFATQEIFLSSLPASMPPARARASESPAPKSERPPSAESARGRTSSSAPPLREQPASEPAARSGSSSSAPPSRSAGSSSAPPANSADASGRAPSSAPPPARSLTPLPRAPLPDSPLPPLAESRPARAPAGGLSRTLIGASYVHNDVAPRSGLPPGARETVSYDREEQLAQAKALGAAKTLQGVKPPSDVLVGTPPAQSRAVIVGTPAEQPQPADNPAAVETTSRRVSQPLTFRPPPKIEHNRNFRIRSELPGPEPEVTSTEPAAPTLDTREQLKLWASSAAVLLSVLILGDLGMSVLYPWPEGESTYEVPQPSSAAPAAREDHTGEKSVAAPPLEAAPSALPTGALSPQPPPSGMGPAGTSDGKVPAASAGPVLPAVPARPGAVGPRAMGAPAAGPPRPAQRKPAGAEPAPGTPPALTPAAAVPVPSPRPGAPSAPLPNNPY